jgi:hypothetical protein
MKNLPNFPAVRYDKIQNDLNEEFKALESGYDERKTRRIEAWKRYNFEKYGTEKSGSSTIVDSTIYNAVQWMVPSLIQPFIETSDFIQIIPESASPRDIIAAEYNRELLNYQMRKRMSLYSTYYDLFKTSLVGGDGFLKLTWVKRNAKMGEPVGRPEYTFVSSDAIRYDWTVKGGFMHSHVVTHEEDWTRSDVIGMKGMPGVYDSKIDEVTGSPGNNMPTDRLRDEQFESKTWVGEKSGGQIEEAKSLYLRREHWTEYDLEGDGKLTPILAVFIDKTLVQVIKNPYDFQTPPFVMMEFDRDPRGNPAMGLSKILEDIQAYRTGILRMTSDNLNSQLNGFYEVDMTNADDIALQLIMNSPQGSRMAIPSRKPGSINPLKTNPMAPQTFQAWEMMEVAGENRGGFTRYSQGMDSKALNQTATGFVGITQRSEMRLWEIATRFAEATLKPLIRMTIALNQQNLQETDIEIQFGINGRGQFATDLATGKQVEINFKPGDLLKVGKKDIAGYFSVNLDLQVGSDKQQKINNLFQWGQYFAPYVQAGIIPAETVQTIAVESARLMDLPKVESQMRGSYAGGRGTSVPTGPTGGTGDFGSGIPGTQGEPPVSEANPSGVSGQITGA